MKKLLSFSASAFLVGTLFSACTAPTTPPTETENTSPTQAMTEETTNMELGPTTASLNGVDITAINHASAVLSWGDTVIYNDPTDALAFAGQPAPDIILVSDIHGDHLNAEALASLAVEDTVIVAPQAVVDELPEGFVADNIIVLANRETTTQKDIAIEAMPMYNLPETADSRHTRGRGNGYVLEKDGTRVYFSGDASDIREMRDLQNIDIAFVCMNMPFTMSVEDAADAVIEFKPATVLPYHYRGQDGLSDVAKFKEIVNSTDPNIEVVQLDWYAEQ